MGKKGRSRSIGSEAEIAESLTHSAEEKSRRDLLENHLPNTIATYNAAETVNTDLQHVGLTSDPLPSNNALHYLPPVLAFLRGGLYLYEAWLIASADRKYLLMDKNEKTFRLWTASFGGILAITGSTTSTLLATKVGFLATATADSLAPIMLSSVSIAFYLMTVARDLHRISVINKGIADIQKIDNFNKATGNKLSHYFDKEKLIKERRETYKNIFFGGLGTAATVAFLVALTVPSFGLSWAVAGALTAVAVSPASFALIKKFVGGIAAFIITAFTATDSHRRTIGTRRATQEPETYTRIKTLDLAAPDNHIRNFASDRDKPSFTCPPPPDKHAFFEDKPPSPGGAGNPSLPAGEATAAPSKKPGS